ncbi:MAG TPA: DinB family protein [Terriglobales bacterium]|nr:DinB family protein [Terriglobales bacterium]
MDRMKSVTLSLLVLFCTTAALSQTKAGAHPTLSEIMDHAVGQVEGEFVPAAEAMPEEKYSFAPTNGEFKGVRTFAEQVKHVAAVNYMVAAAVLQEKPPVELGGENGPTSITTKADIVKFLKDSFAYSHKAMSSINEKNQTDQIKSPFGDGTVSRIGIATAVLWHPFDHYGQMVVYLRMNGIIPPASRQ